MALSATAIFDLIAPLYKNDVNKSSWLQMASDEISTCFYGKNRNRAVALLAAHQIVLTNRDSGNGEAGSIAGKREGDLSLNFASASPVSDPDLSQTHYGRQLLALNKKSNMGVSVTGGLDNGCNANNFVGDLYG